MMWSGVKQLMWIALVQKWRNRLVLERRKVYGFRSGAAAERSVGRDALSLGKNIATFFTDCWTTTALKNIRKYAHYDSQLESVVRGSCKIWGSHSGIAEDSSILGCATVSLGTLFLMFFKGHNAFVFVVEQSDSWSAWCRWWWWWCALLLLKHCTTFWRHSHSSRRCDLPVQQHTVTSQ